MDFIQKALDLDEKTFIDRIIDWADEFGFTIEEDVVIINKDSVDNFIKMLDKQFSSWEKKEALKEGKF